VALPGRWASGLLGAVARRCSSCCRFLASCSRLLTRELWRASKHRSKGEEVAEEV
jgi:hypothetical protein